MDLQSVYFERCEDREFVVDENQLAAIAAIEAFFDEQSPQTNSAERRRGLYIWGSVGRGKTFLMDLAFERLDMPKRRVHFHALMREIRDGLAQLRGANPMRRLAQAIAPPGSVLCIDELHVSDLDNAMLLEVFLKELVKNRLVVVTTSNFSPEALFPEPTDDAFGVAWGKRQLMIARAEVMHLLERHFDVLTLAGAIDYRRDRRASGTSRFFVGGERSMLLDLVASQAIGQPRSSSFTVFGRPVVSLWRSTRGLVFDFESICLGRYSFRDYLAILDDVGWLGVADVDIDSLDAARRFSWLIEIAYDRGIHLSLTSPRAAHALFQRIEGAPSHIALEHERVVSRVIEMTNA